MLFIHWSVSYKLKRQGTSPSFPNWANASIPISLHTPSFVYLHNLTCFISSNQIFRTSHMLHYPLHTCFPVPWLLHYLKMLFCFLTVFLERIKWKLKISTRGHSYIIHYSHHLSIVSWLSFSSHSPFWNTFTLPSSHIHTVLFFIYTLLHPFT